MKLVLIDIISNTLEAILKRKENFNNKINSKQKIIIISLAKPIGIGQPYFKSGF
jgi:hypothetical protein